MLNNKWKQQFGSSCFYQKIDKTNCKSVCLFIAMSNDKPSYLNFRSADYV
ncbi:hypothetical protein FM120_16735 [Sphingobacterium faecium PCAi_F2.5]|nr:hypothetical protein FM120_16735 [Sphingobacterium faecium PCAi_F2.5]